MDDTTRIEHKEQRVSTTSGDGGGEKRRTAQYKTNQIIWYIVGLIEVLLALRFLFYLFGANPESPFLRFIYGLSGIFVFPFKGIFPTFAEGVAVFEWSVLVAMAIYALIAWGIVRLFKILAARKPEEEI